VEYFPPAAAIGVRAPWELSNDTPVTVTEKGIATDDDSRRIDSTCGALEGLHECLEDGINLLGYWSASTTTSGLPASRQPSG
jgi:beta-glucosidase